MGNVWLLVSMKDDADFIAEMLDCRRWINKGYVLFVRPGSSLYLVPESVFSIKDPFEIAAKISHAWNTETIHVGVTVYGEGL